MGKKFSSPESDRLSKLRKERTKRVVGTIGGAVVGGAIGSIAGGLAGKAGGKSWAKRNPDSSMRSSKNADVISKSKGIGAAAGGYLGGMAGGIKGSDWSTKGYRSPEVKRSERIERKTLKPIVRAQKKRKNL